MSEAAALTPPMPSPQEALRSPPLSILVLIHLLSPLLYDTTNINAPPTGGRGCRTAVAIHPQWLLEEVQ